MLVLGNLFWYFFFFASFFLWAVHIIRRTLFFLFFWQIKEYRLDRFLEEARRRPVVVFSKFFWGAVILFVFWLFWPLQRIAFGPWPETFIFIFYLSAGSYAFYLLARKRWALPRFTKKMVILFLSVLGAEGALTLLFFPSWLVFALALEILFPWFIFAVLKIVEIPVFFTKRAIIEKAKRKIEKFSGMKTIGITGSFGKTATKEILYALLAGKYRTFKTADHINTEMGVAKTVLEKADEKKEIFICEMAAYKKGEVRAICEITHPRIGILTGINQQHLALFGSQEKIIEGKYELIESLPEDGLAVFNGENRYCLELYKKTKKPKKVYGLADKIDGIFVDVWADNIEIGKKGSSFRAVCRDGSSFDFQINLLGKAGLLNVLGAICVAKEMGIDLPEMAQICGDLGPEAGGMVLKKGIKETAVIDSAYSANPDGVISALDYLSLWEGRKKIVIMPCLIELGKASAEVHKTIGRKIAQVADLAIITTRDRIKELKEGAEEVLPGAAKKIIFLKNTGEVIKKINDFCQPGDAILLEGRVSTKLIKQLVKE